MEALAKYIACLTRVLEFVEAQPDRPLLSTSTTSDDSGELVPPTERELFTQSIHLQLLATYADAAVEATTVVEPLLLPAREAAKAYLYTGSDLGLERLVRTTKELALIHKAALQRHTSAPEAVVAAPASPSSSGG